MGVNKTCGGFGEDLPSGRGKVRTKETKRGRQRKRKHSMYYVLYTHKRYSFYIAVIGKRDD